MAAPCIRAGPSAGRNRPTFSIPFVSVIAYWPERTSQPELNAPIRTRQQRGVAVSPGRSNSRGRLCRSRTSSFKGVATPIIRGRGSCGKKEPHLSFARRMLLAFFVIAGITPALRRPSRPFQASPSSGGSVRRAPQARHRPSRSRPCYPVWAARKRRIRFGPVRHQAARQHRLSARCLGPIFQRQARRRLAALNR